MRLKNGLRKKTIKAIKTILLIMNDKEKIKEVFDSMQYAEASRFKHMKELLEEIKKILEK